MNLETAKVERKIVFRIQTIKTPDVILEGSTYLVLNQFENGKKNEVKSYSNYTLQDSKAGQFTSNLNTAGNETTIALNSTEYINEKHCMLKKKRSSLFAESRNAELAKVSCESRESNKEKICSAKNLKHENLEIFHVKKVPFKGFSDYFDFDHNLCSLFDFYHYCSTICKEEQGSLVDHGLSKVFKESMFRGFI